MVDSAQHKQSTQPNKTSLNEDYGKLAVFILISLTLTALLLAGFHFFLHEASNLSSYLEFTTRTVSAILNFFGEPNNISISSHMSLTVLQGDYNTSLRVGKDSSGIVEALILLSLIICWPSTLTKKLLACTGCILIMFLLNAARIAGTFLIEIHFPTHTVNVGEIGLPLVYALCNALYFLVWIKWSNRHPLD